MTAAGSRRARLLRWWFRAGLAALVVLLAGCAPEAPQDYLNYPVGEQARRADRLWDVTFLIAAVIFFIVEGVLVYALIKFRHRPGREAAQFHGNTKAEVILTLIPALILAGLAIPTVATVFGLAQRPEGKPLEVKVVGHQFWWEYQYPEQDGIDEAVFTANELHIPTDRPVFLTLEGAPDDVIHSFWPPRLAGKQDVIPGRTTHMTIEAPTPGVYLGQCTEYCGLSHANMRLRVIAQSPEDFQEWIEQQQLPARPVSGQAADGRRLFLEGACAGCHTIEGTTAGGRVGPDLTHFASRETFAGSTFHVDNREQLAAWLDDPPAQKPGARMPDLGLSGEEIQDLIAFLYTLK